MARRRQWERMTRQTFLTAQMKDCLADIGAARKKAKPAAAPALQDAMDKLAQAVADGDMSMKRAFKEIGKLHKAGRVVGGGMALTAQALPLATEIQRSLALTCAVASAMSLSRCFSACSTSLSPAWRASRFAVFAALSPSFSISLAAASAAASCRGLPLASRRSLRA